MDLDDGEFDEKEPEVRSLLAFSCPSCLHLTVAGCSPLLLAEAQPVVVADTLLLLVEAQPVVVADTLLLVEALPVVAVELRSAEEELLHLLAVVLLSLPLLLSLSLLLLSLSLLLLSLSLPLLSKRSTHTSWKMRWLRITALLPWLWIRAVLLHPRSARLPWWPQVQSDGRKSIARKDLRRSCSWLSLCATSASRSLI
jgi:hypothetical protein